MGKNLKVGLIGCGAIAEHLHVSNYTACGEAELVALCDAKVGKAKRLADIGDFVSGCEVRRQEGYLYGDFQFSTDASTEDFLRKGVFCCYRPVESSMHIESNQKRLTKEHWLNLLALAHGDKGRAYETYVGHYLETSGQIYWSDTHQLSTYVDDYHEIVDEHLGDDVRGTEIITELYVPRARLEGFMVEAAADFRKHEVDVIYGTVRLIERDEESFLAWAREPWACVIFNLHVVHTEEGVSEGAAAFRRLIDKAITCGGSYFLTYHKWATREQVLACHPRFVYFLRRKKQYDPAERFQSDWYRHYREMFRPNI